MNLENVMWDSVFIKVAEKVTASLVQRPGKNSSNFLRRTFEEVYAEIYKTDFPFNWKLFERFTTNVIQVTDKGKSLAATKSFLNKLNPESKQKQIDELRKQLRELEGANLVAV